MAVTRSSTLPSSDLVLRTIRPWYLRLIGVWLGWMDADVIAVRRSGDPLGTRKLHGIERGGKRVFDERALHG